MVARYLGRLTPLNEALNMLTKKARPVDSTATVASWEAEGMVLAEDVIAPIDVPPFNRAAFDGYAARSEDTPGELEVVGEVVIGALPKVRIGPGQAAYVSTGSFIPEGANTVIPEEDVERVGSKVIVKKHYDVWKNVDPKGSQVKKGEVLARKGTVLTYPDIVGLLAAGVGEVKVYRKLRISLIATGSELYRPTSPREVMERTLRGEVVETTATLVRWFITRYVPWAEIVEQLMAPDSPETVAWYISRLLERSDIVLVTGGSGPSRVDVFYMLPSLLGGELVFRGLDVKGGRPTTAITVKGKVVIGLSGYPLSALHIMVRLVYPLLRWMGNVRQCPPILYYARVDGTIQEGPPRPIKVVAYFDSKGELWVRPLEAKLQLSSATVGFPLANGVAFVDRREYRHGDIVPTLLYSIPHKFNEPGIAAIK